MNYRQNLTSTANFNPNNISEKIFTLAEIKKMKPVNKLHLIMLM